MANRFILNETSFLVAEREKTPQRNRSAGF